ncbi:hypothetical protein [Streptomyces hyaluromycini]|uniref:hypothetical protein n=1 Tax=Streptomyces hyaluromycini TaxID=1377993 RepID=UPI0011AE2250|nr:hypothetical protein [Streptomyces hyaluromycini]
MDIRASVIRQGIANDAAWVGRLAADFGDPERAECAGVISLCVMPYIALFVHESYAKLATSDPVLAAHVSTDFKAIVARARHSLKLFEDTNRGIGGQLDYFRDEIRAAHAGHFTSNAPRTFRFLETDLGLFSYGSRLISTTHAANFHLGISPRATLAMTGQEIMAITEQYGRYFGHLGAQVPAGGGATFFSKIDPREMGEIENDTHSADYYGRGFDGPGNMDLNALLAVFRCMVNFVSTAIPSVDSDGGFDYTEFKIRFLTIYQVLGSLKVLRTDQRYPLTPRSTRALQEILDAPAARVIMNRSARPFRNTLVHYNLNRHIDLSKVDFNAPMFNLASVYFPSCNDLDDLAEIVEQALENTAAVIDEWADPEGSV